mgnify:CR=1 FL=1
MVLKINPTYFEAVILFLILTDKYEDTLDNLMMGEDITIDMWHSILMQIIMTLITYQKVYKLTHNDLHTSNIMYDSTELKYLYYKLSFRHI